MKDICLLSYQYYIFIYATKVIYTIFIFELLNKNRLKINQIKYFIFHQASKVVIDNLIRKINLPANKVFCNYEKIGNTVSSTIPIALHDLNIRKKIKRGDRLLLCGFGVGYSMAASIIEY